VTLSDIGNLGEAISAIAVVASLVYLSIQIRQNTRQMRHSSDVSRLLLQENFVSGQQRWFQSLLENEEAYRIWRVGTTATQELEADDREKFGILLYSQMYRYQLMFQARSVEPLERARVIVQIDRLADMHAFRSWWRRQRDAFISDEGFVALVDARLAARAASVQA